MPLEEIETVEWLNNLPAIDIRTNGFAFGYTLVGNFRMHDLGTAKLHIYSSGPLIKIQTEKKLYFLNFKDSTKTKKYYNEILLKTN